MLLKHLSKPFSNEQNSMVFPKSGFLLQNVEMIFFSIIDLFIAIVFMQWSYGFYLIHIQGQNGLEVYCKTKDLKKKWLEQFQMAL